MCWETQVDVRPTFRYESVNFALETDQRFKAAAMGKGEYQWHHGEFP